MYSDMLNNKRNNNHAGLLTVKDVATLLHVHSSTVRRWSDIGLLEPYRINNRGDRRYKREDIDLFLAHFNSHRKSEGNTV